MFCPLQRAWHVACGDVFRPGPLALVIGGRLIPLFLPRGVPPEGAHRGGEKEGAAGGLLTRPRGPGLYPGFAGAKPAEAGYHNIAAAP